MILADGKLHRTHFFVTPGLFIKYFQGKKSLKKNKSLKLLMSRFMRKLLLVLKLKDVGIVTRGTPVHIEQLLSFLFKPLSHPFLDPLSGERINEADSTRGPKKTALSIGITSIRFDASKPYSYQKTKKKGRIKRKI